MKKFVRAEILGQKLSVSPERESAVVHFVQTDLLSFGDKTELSDQGPAVGSAAEASSVTMSLDSPRTGAHSVESQGEETTFQPRSRAPVTLDKTRVTPPDESQEEFSDDSHGSGGTQELQVDCGGHSSQVDTQQT